MYLPSGDVVRHAGLLGGDAGSTFEITLWVEHFHRVPQACSSICSVVADIRFMGFYTQKKVAAYEIIT